MQQLKKWNFPSTCRTLPVVDPVQTRNSTTSQLTNESSGAQLMLADWSNSCGHIGGSMASASSNKFSLGLLTLMWTWKQSSWCVGRSTSSFLTRQVWYNLSGFGSVPPLWATHSSQVTCWSPLSVDSWEACGFGALLAALRTWLTMNHWLRANDANKVIVCYCASFIWFVQHIISQSFCLEDITGMWPGKLLRRLCCDFNQFTPFTVAKL